jgi:hypothetical protein
MALYEQLRSITDQAISIIKLRLKETNGIIHFYDELAAFNGEELEDDFLKLVPEINHYFDYEGNLVCYPLSIKGGEYDATLSMIDEQGSVHEVDIFELDAHNLTLLADAISEPKS